MIEEIELEDGNLVAAIGLWCYSTIIPMMALIGPYALVGLLTVLLSNFGGHLGEITLNVIESIVLTIDPHYS